MNVIIYYKNMICKTSFIWFLLILSIIDCFYSNERTIFIWIFFFYSIYILYHLSSISSMKIYIEFWNEYSIAMLFIILMIFYLFKIQIQSSLIFLLYILISLKNLSNIETIISSTLQALSSIYILWKLDYQKTSMIMLFWELNIFFI